MFWGATYRKIVEIIAVDKSVNDPKAKKRIKPHKNPEKIGLSEALKRF
jgi:hypothetical protein